MLGGEGMVVHLVTRREARRISFVVMHYNHEPVPGLGHTKPTVSVKSAIYLTVFVSGNFHDDTSSKYFQAQHCTGCETIVVNKSDSRSEYCCKSHDMDVSI